MKAKVYTFLLIAALITGALPTYNLAHRVMEGNYKNLGWKKLGSLYAVDGLMLLLGDQAHARGLSINSQDVLIGKDLWLFYLGGTVYSETTVESKRRGISPDRAVALARVIAWMTGWNDWLRKNGVQEFRFMIGPDKESIYPEYLPAWAAPAKVQISDILPDVVPPTLYVDTYPPIRAASARYAGKAPPLTTYYKNDTHWNHAGAWAAMEALMESLEATRPSLARLDPALGTPVGETDKIGGDLGSFLRLSKPLRDPYIILKFDTEVSPRTEYYNVASGQRLAPDDPNISEAPHYLTEMKTSNALNQKKVLWLHDSFGIGMYGFMRATFSDILHIHPQNISQDALAALVKSYKPDYVIVTVVERHALTKTYNGMPPE